MAHFVNSTAQSYEASLNKLLPAHTNLMTLKKEFIFIFTAETCGLFLKILFGLRGWGSVWKSEDIPNWRRYFRNSSQCVSIRANARFCILFSRLFLSQSVGNFHLQKQGIFFQQKQHKWGRGKISPRHVSSRILWEERSDGLVFATWY